MSRQEDIDIEPSDEMEEFRRLRDEIEERADAFCEQEDTSISPIDLLLSALEYHLRRAHQIAEYIDSHDDMK